jgi:predicted RNA binding protein YcfA (HicA-like mRNA interferase family)
VYTYIHQEAFVGVIYTADELIRMIKDDGWVLDRVVGSHHVFIHKAKPGIVVVPKHVKDIPKGTANNILKQAGLK